MIQNKNAFVFLTAGLMFLTGSLRADDATPASTTPAASDSTTPAAAPAAAAPAAAPKKMTIKEAMKAAGDLADAGKTDEAIAAYEAIGKLPSKRGESWRQNSEGLAYLEAATPEPDKAIPVLENAVAINADNYFAWNNLGSAYEQTDQPKKAEDAYQKAIDTGKAAGASTDKAEANLKALQAKTGDAAAAGASGSATSDASTSVTSGSAVPDNSTPGAGAVSSK
jgi:tetratricopeptide (TPR) repeat protein